MYVCVYICRYVCVYLCICVRVCICMYVCMYVYVCMTKSGSNLWHRFARNSQPATYVCEFVCLCVCVSNDYNVCVCVCACVCVCVCVADVVCGMCWPVTQGSLFLMVLKPRRTSCS